MNQLTPEQLDMVKRLQPLFKSKMGEWKHTDEWICIETGLHGNIPATMIYPIGNVLRIPKPIDWQNPERGLWGILEGTKTLYDHGLGVSHKTGYKYYPEPDPFTALLMALVQQEGV